ncbi:MAG: hypothetical protein AB7O59_12255 [Pirellulales bacterium]
MRFHRALSLALVLVCVLTLRSRAEDFRVETKVFTGKEKTPASQNLTLFQAGYVYDYLSDPERVAVFDKAHGRFILLDPDRKVKVEIKTEDVLVFSEKRHDKAALSANAFLRFAADPEFKVEFDVEGELTLASEHLTYRVETVPAQSEATALQYREFSDWYARFNSMIYLGSTPPFPRLEVNRELAKRTLVPTKVSLTIPAQSSSGVRATQMRAEHHVSWRLLQRDLERLSETANQLATFQAVDLAEFQPDAVTKR